jgi:hypothetical protein
MVPLEFGIECLKLGRGDVVANRAGEFWAAHADFQPFLGQDMALDASRAALAIISACR